MVVDSPLVMSALLFLASDRRDIIKAKNSRLSRLASTAVLSSAFSHTQLITSFKDSLMIMTAEVDVVPTIDVDFKPIFWDNPATEPISDPPSPKSGRPLKSAYLALVLNQPSMESEDPPTKSEYSSLESDFSSGPNSSAEMIHKVEVCTPSQIHLKVAD